MSVYLQEVHAADVVTGDGPRISARHDRFGGNLQAAADWCATNGRTLYIPGVWSISSTLTIRCPVDADRDSEIQYTGANGIAVHVDGVDPSPLWNTSNRMVFPKIRNMSKTSGTWSGVTGAVGLRMTNLRAADCWIPEITGFESGHVLVGDGQGTVYNQFRYGRLVDNMRGLSLIGVNGGWVNENCFTGGQWVVGSSHGTAVEGVCHLYARADTFVINNNRFFGCSLESPGVVEYHVDAESFSANSFFGCRWENAEGPVIRWGGLCRDNAFFAGNATHLLTFVVEGTQNGRTHILGCQANTISGTVLDANGAVLMLSNENSTNAGYLRTYAAGALVDPATNLGTAWLWNMTGLTLQGKSAGTAPANAPLVLTANTGVVKANQYTGPEIADPSAPAANNGILFFRDSGAGKTQLCVRFATGAVQILATEP